MCEVTRKPTDIRSSMYKRYNKEEMMISFVSAYHYSITKMHAGCEANSGVFIE